MKTKFRFRHLALYSICRNVSRCAASLTDLASLVLNMLFRFSVSHAIVLLSLTTEVENLWAKSARRLATFSYSRASARRALARFALPFRLRESSRWARLILRSAFLKNRGFSRMPPSESVAKRSKPTSTPIDVSVSIEGFGKSGRSNSATRETYHLPVASRLNLALLSGKSRARDCLTLTHPILGI